MSQPGLQYLRITEAQYENAMGALNDAEQALKDLRDEDDDEDITQYFRKIARADLVSVAAVLTTLASITPAQRV